MRFVVAPLKHLVLCFAALAIFALGAPSSGWAQEKADPMGRDAIFGSWQTEDADGVVVFAPCADHKICGRFAWLKEDDPAHRSVDEKNPDPEKRSRVLCGMTFISDLSWNAETRRYEGGSIYSPRHGQSFSADLRLLAPDRLELRGFVLFSVLGQSQEWTRAVSHVFCDGFSK